MAAFKFVREVPTFVPAAVGEPPTKYFATGTGTAMVVLSPASGATNHNVDLAAGPPICELAANHEGKQPPRETSENSSSGPDCDDVLVLKRKLKSLKRKYLDLNESVANAKKSSVVVIESADHSATGSLFKSILEHHTHSSSFDMMRNEIVSALDHFREENSRRFASSVKDLANVFVKLIPIKRRVDPKASPAKDEANAKEESATLKPRLDPSPIYDKSQSDGEGSIQQKQAKSDQFESPPDLQGHIQEVQAKEQLDPLLDLQGDLLRAEGSNSPDIECIGHYIPNNLASLEAPSFSLGIDDLEIERHDE